MIAFQDQAIILNTKRYSENKLILDLLTSEKGRYKGISYKSKKNSFNLGAYVHIHWNARLEDQLGYAQVESLEDLSIPFLFDPLPLRIIILACQLLAGALPERHPYPMLFQETLTLLRNPTPKNYALFEVLFLKELGFGLDFSQCAATLSQEDLCWVSPKSGKAVSRKAGEPYKDILLDLPSFLYNPYAPCAYEMIESAFKLTGFFIRKHFSTCLFFSDWYSTRETAFAR